jgi:pimeloyl-ACP methyl ester carboxylesterase
MTTCTIDATRGSIQAGAARLSYLEWPGGGPPLLLLHGITSSAATLWQAGPALAAAGYHVFALDMPGHGESDMSAAHDIDTIASMAGALIIGRGLRGTTLIGHSWGGAASLALASGDHPARAELAKVVLIDPALGMHPRRGAAALPAYLEGVALPPEANLGRLRANNPDWAECDIYWKAQALANCRPAQVAGFFTGSGEWSLLDRVAAVDAPLLILVADPQHSVIPADRLGELAAALRPGLGALQVIPGTTHNMLRGPGYAPTMAALREWLSAA